MTVTFLALGSNLGDRSAHLKYAVEELQKYGIQVNVQSSVFETEPKEVVDQPVFLNAVVKATTRLLPRQLLEICLTIERDGGRVRSGEKSARTLDLDILFYGEQVIEEPGLSVPHPRFSQRNFVLISLAEIAPDFIDPGSGRTIQELLNDSPDHSQVRLFEPL